VEGASLLYRWTAFVPDRLPVYEYTITNDSIVAPPERASTLSAIYGWQCKAVRTCNHGVTIESDWSERAFVQVNDM
jgi:hypothetical protein